MKIVNKMFGIGSPFRQMALITGGGVLTLAVGFILSYYSPVFYLVFIAVSFAPVLIFFKPIWGLLLIVFLDALYPLDRMLTGDGFLTIAKIVAIFTLIVIFIRKAFERQKIRFTGFEIWPLIFIGYSLVSLLWTTEFELGFEDVVSLISLFLLYFITVQLITTISRWKMLISTWIVSIFALSFYLFSVGESPFSNSTGAFFGSRFGYAFGNPNILGQWLLLLLGIVLARYLFAGTFMAATFYFLLTSWVLFLMITTGSRGTWIGAVITILSVLIICQIKKVNVVGFKKRSFIIRGSILFIGLTVGTLSVSTTLIQRFDYLFRSPNDFVLRQGDIERSWYTFLENPILGTGVGDYKIESREVMTNYGIGVAPSSSHNLYLGTLARLGILGLISLFLIYYGIYKKARQRVKMVTQQYPLDPDSIGLWGSILGFIFLSIFHTGIYMNMLWVCYGLISADSMLTKHQQPEIEASR